MTLSEVGMSSGAMILKTSNKLDISNKSNSRKKLIKNRNGGFSLTSLNKYNSPKVNIEENKVDEDTDSVRFKLVIKAFFYTYRGLVFHQMIFPVHFRIKISKSKF